MPYYFRPPHGSHLTRPYLGNGNPPPADPLERSTRIWEILDSILPPPGKSLLGPCPVPRPPSFPPSRLAIAVHSPALSRNANSSHMTSRFTFTPLVSPNVQVHALVSHLPSPGNPPPCESRHPVPSAQTGSRHDNAGPETDTLRYPFPEDKRRPETTVTYCASARRDRAYQQPARHPDFTRACPFVVQGSVSFTFW
ncbi:hypothetical protein BGZ61DRAFT_569152 [Ilyonectria robusta]|uniref:uncharacterized protein n=1 Tax=Ilyonectria robusta TaxID=1079257 RepID=UPI001E8CC943|nr:uncharacterized protein BGZ61DRAFT_569152 [Ilyonectria robusta]KAH8729431.1 hypothetical protein BGZ61DRAFT_569152 [Ilyonectria robusta]